ncbi:MAG: hypothetical protein ACRC0F_00860 [Cetobacterium sp.]
MKKILLFICLSLNLLIVGCSPTLRQVKDAQIERPSDELQVQLLSTAQLQVQGLYFEEAGVIIEIKNISQNMISINLNNSSMVLSGINGENTSRIINGNDRIKNINSIVPNIVILPNSTVKLTLYPADLLEANYYSGQITGFSVIPQFKTINKVRLALAYHGEVGNELNLGKTKYFMASYKL